MRSVAEIALVNRAEERDPDDVEAIGALRRVEALDNPGEHLGMNLDFLGEMRFED